MSAEDVFQGKFPIILDKKSGAPLWMDLRELKLRYMLPVASLRKFFEGLVKGALYGTICEKCGAKYFPPRKECSNCGASETKWVELSREGKLLSFTVVSVKPESYQQNSDYVVGLAELKDGFKVLAWVKCDDPMKLKRGMKVKIEIGKRSGDEIQIYYIVPEG
ncbi:MAG: Zn-ribbon domain-containing OB-fold protein [Thaumarchaeota archaeon]|nr:Zn-ribbon domain-containing OB-fold protein [Nitrososphaerota archaeon]